MKVAIFIVLMFIMCINKNKRRLDFLNYISSSLILPLLFNDNCLSHEELHNVLHEIEMAFAPKYVNKATINIKT